MLVFAVSFPSVSDDVSLSLFLSLLLLLCVFVCLCVSRVSCVCVFVSPWTYRLCVYVHVVPDTRYRVVPGILIPGISVTVSGECDADDVD